MSGVLAIDASSANGSLVYQNNNQETIDVPLIKNVRHNTEWIASVVQAGIAAKDISDIVLNIGPGSFTGLRSVCAWIQTWGLVQPDLRIYAVPHTHVWQAKHMASKPSRAGVCMLAWKRGTAWGMQWRSDGTIILPPADRAVGEFVQQAPKVVDLFGDLPVDFQAPTGWTIVDTVCGATDVLQAYHMQENKSTWQVKAGVLSPLYPREAEAVTLWRQNYSSV